MSEFTTTRWNREFEEIGVDKVRSDLILGRWEAEKRRAARQWLERRDAQKFQASRAGDTSPGFGTFFLNKRNAKWWGYAAAALLLVMGVMRLWRRW